MTQIRTEQNINYYETKLELIIYDQFGYDLYRSKKISHDQPLRTFKLNPDGSITPKDDF